MKLNLSGGELQDADTENFNLLLTLLQSPRCTDHLTHLGFEPFRIRDLGNMEKAALAIGNLSQLKMLNLANFGGKEKAKTLAEQFITTLVEKLKTQKVVEPVVIVPYAGYQTHLSDAISQSILSHYARYLAHLHLHQHIPLKVIFNTIKREQAINIVAKSRLPCVMRQNCRLPPMMFTSRQYLA